MGYTANNFNLNNPEELSELFYELTVRVRDLEDKVESEGTKAEIETAELAELRESIEQVSATFWGFVNSWLHILTSISARIEQATGVSLDDITVDIPKKS